MRRHFFLSLGTTPNLSTDDIITARMKTACENVFIGPVRSSEYKVQNLIVTIYTYGIHRAIQVELPPKAESDNEDERTVQGKAEAFYKELENAADNISCKTYDSSQMNCVTAVGKILYLLDNNCRTQKEIFPWNLDKKVKYHFNRYNKDSTAGIFYAKYQELMFPQ